MVNCRKAEIGVHKGAMREEERATRFDVEEPEREREKDRKSLPIS